MSAIAAPAWQLPMLQQVKNWLSHECNVKALFAVCDPVQLSVLPALFGMLRPNMNYS